MADHFHIQPHTTVDKSFEITGPEGVSMKVDYDDVNHEEVDLVIGMMVDTLNSHWGRELFRYKLAQLRERQEKDAACDS